MNTHGSSATRDEEPKSWRLTPPWRIERGNKSAAFSSFSGSMSYRTDNEFFKK